MGRGMISMKKILSALLLTALLTSLLCAAFAAKFVPDEADKNYASAGWYRVSSKVPEDHTYSYIYDKPSSTKGKNLGRADDGAKVYIYYTMEGIGKQGTIWGYCSCDGKEGYIRFSNVVTEANYVAPAPTPMPTATATAKPTATATAKPTATPTPKPTAKPTANPELVKMTVVNCKQWVSLRETPSTKATRLKEVALGETVIGYKYDDTWTACYYDDAFGYILSEYLK